PIPQTSPRPKRQSSKTLDPQPLNPLFQVRDKILFRILSDLLYQFSMLCVERTSLVTDQIKTQLQGLQDVGPEPFTKTGAVTRTVATVLKPLCLDEQVIFRKPLFPRASPSYRTNVLQNHCPA